MTAPDPAKAVATGVAPGTLVAGRFQTERTAFEDALGVVLAAKDQKTGKPVSLRLVSRALTQNPKATEALRAEVMKIAALSHRSLVAAYGAKFVSAVNAVSAKLTNAAMIAMNKAVAVDKKTAASVAGAFLKANGLA